MSPRGASGKEYPAERGDMWIEFDSMINVRPSQGNRSRGVDDKALAEGQR
jgi:uncharacterized protein DUF5674